MFLMALVVTLVFLILGLVLLTKGADWLVDGSSDLARYLKISPLLVGLTVVALGTSLPEFVVSLIAALGGSPDIAFGNIIGSNITNIGLIIGLSALIFPLVVRSTTIMYEFPFLLVSSFLLLLLANDSYIFGRNTFSIGGLDGIIFVAMLGFFLWYVVTSAKTQKNGTLKQFAKEYKHVNPLWKNSFFIVLGATLLVIGSKLFVSNASLLARLWGVSEGIIGLTIVSIGTSLPELFTAVVAAWKKEGDIAVGNIVGSNIFNVLLVLGVVSLIQPIAVDPVLLFKDGIIMILFSVAFILFATMGKKIRRWEGAVLFFGYIIYLLYLLSRMV